MAEDKPPIHVEVVTNQCAEGEAYMFDLPDSIDWYDIHQAIKTLYGHEGVTSIFITTEE